jgi:hypothetical protein
VPCGGCDRADRSSCVCRARRRCDAVSRRGWAWGRRSMCLPASHGQTQEMRALLSSQMLLLAHCAAYGLSTLTLLVAGLWVLQDMSAPATCRCKRRSLPALLGKNAADCHGISPSTAWSTAWHGLTWQRIALGQCDVVGIPRSRTQANAILPLLCHTHT